MRIANPVYVVGGRWCRGQPNLECSLGPKGSTEGLVTGPAESDVTR